ncbi:MAG: ABC transporter permease [Pseudomonadota bacterium]
MSLWNQTAAVAAMNVKGLPQRRWPALATIVAIAVVVAVMMAFLSMAEGFKKTVAGTGAHDMALIMREGSQAELNSGLTAEQVKLIAEAPGVARQDGVPQASFELYVIVDGVKRSTGTSVNLPLRGMGPEGLALRPGIRIVEGRMFTPGVNELVVGRAAQGQFSGLEVGEHVTFGKTRWQVVGAFDAGGSVFESELWADVRVVQNMYNRGNTYQSVRARLDGVDALERIEAYAKADPRLNLSIQTEADYFAQLSKPLIRLIQWVGYPLAVIMALGALAGALNAMYSSVAARQREIVTLRAIGFGGLSTFVGTMAEAVILTLAGTLLGMGAAYLFFDGLSASTLGQSFTQVVFDFDVSPALAGQAALLALGIALIGGFFPALRAARQPVVDAFRTA